MIKIILVTAVWCPSCLIMRPRYINLISKNPSVGFEELDFDTDETILKPFVIGKTLPVVIVKDDQRELLRIVGEKTPHEIERLLKPFL